MKILLLFSFVLIAEHLYSQDLTLSQTVDYINNKLSANQKVQYDNYYHDHKYLNQIEVTANGNLIIYNFDNNRSPNSSFSPCYLTKYSLQIYKTILLPYKNGNDYISFSGKTKWEGTTDCNKKNIEPYIEGSNGVVKFTNGEEIGEPLYNAFTHLFNLVKANSNMAPKKDVNDPFATKPIEPGQLFTGSTSNVIKMEKLGGVYTIPVVINGVLKINFIYDSGASDVSISPDIALTLVKTGTLKPEDFIGTQKYYFADGSSATSKVFYIRQIQIGNQTISDVKASISTNIDAPMLLGQSVMQKFGKITIDNSAGTLTFVK